MQSSSVRATRCSRRVAAARDSGPAHRTARRGIEAELELRAAPGFTFYPYFTLFSYTVHTVSRYTVATLYRVPHSTPHPRTRDTETGDAAQK